MQPGGCDIFDRWGGKSETPAHKLVDIGYDAVPQLIEHLTDERFTRSVEFHRNFYFSHHVLRVNHCAVAVLEKIAGLYFPRGENYKTPADLSSAVRAWYDEISKKGEAAYLIEATERGDKDSGEMGRRLLNRYPKDALASLMKGASACGIGHVRATLVDLIASQKGEGTLDFLVKEVTEGPLAQPRLDAAIALHKLGRRQGLSAMIEWWKSTAEPKLPPEHPAAWSGYIAEYISSCMELEAIGALGADLEKRPLRIRMNVVQALGGRRDYGFERAPKEQSVQVKSAKESVLISTLDDTQESLGESGSMHGKTYVDPRVCDIAGTILQELDPNKYHFDLSLPVRARDRQLAVMKNVWRKANNLEPIALPLTRLPRAIPAETLRPFVDRYVGPKVSARGDAEKDVYDLGLGALPGIVELRKRSTGDSDRKLLDGLAKRLACVVVDVAFERQTRAKDAKAPMQLESMKGKPFDPHVFISAIGAALDDSSKVASGIHAIALRAGDGTGFSIRLKELAVGSTDPPSQWSQSEIIRVGNDFARRVSVASSQRSDWAKVGYPELESALTGAIASEPDRQIEVRLVIVPQWHDATEGRKR